jgi:hypothetical protein
MRQLIAIAILLGLVAQTAHARPEICFSAAAGEGGATNAVAPGCGEPPDPTPTCPVRFPVPTNAAVCLCKTTSPNISPRCNNIPTNVCNALIANALAVGLITADAQAYWLNNGFCPIVISGVLTDLCPNGCFDGDTQILTGMGHDGSASYTAAAELLPSHPLVTLSDKSGMDAFDLVSRPISRVVYGPEKPALFVFAMSNGATLRVTSHHPMVLDSGVIVEAAKVELGAAFVGIDGEPVFVKAIDREPATGDVFNFETRGDGQLGHVMAAEGVLVGDLKLQNELAAEETLIALRR